MSQINDGPVEPGVRRVNKERVGSLNIPPKFMEKQSVKDQFEQHSVLAG